MTRKTGTSIPEINGGAEGGTLRPSSLGLLCLAFTTVLFSLYQAGVASVHLLGIVLVYGGIGQLLAGMSEWRKNNSFGTVLFSALGLFWLSLVALIVLPSTGFGRAPSASSMAVYMGMWGLFPAVLLSGFLFYSRTLQAVLGLLAVFFLLLGIGAAAGSTTFTAMAGYLGLACGALTTYAGIAQLVNRSCGRTVIPLGEMRKA